MSRKTNFVPFNRTTTGPSPYLGTPDPAPLRVTSSVALEHMARATMSIRHQVKSDDSLCSLTTQCWLFKFSSRPFNQHIILHVR